jgi:Plavaka transposase
MEDGINMICPDRKRRLCFPKIAAYIADYEEQRMLASILSGHCVKCTIPAFRKSAEDIEFNPSAVEDGISQDVPPLHVSGPERTSRGQNVRFTPYQGPSRNTHPTPTPVAFAADFPRRTEMEARTLRLKMTSDELKEHGYHDTMPFTEYFGVVDNHVDIHRILAPDLLHQASKCFYDYIHKWVIAVIEKAKGSSEKTKGEIDARFSQIPPYPTLRAFRKGLSTTNRWTGNEYKQMLRVYIGVIKGLVPDSVVEIVKFYLHVHRLSHFVSHTDDTLKMLENSIRRMAQLRNDPDGPLVSMKIIPSGWRCPKFHMMDHYTEWVRSMGTLPLSSTDRTEPWHTPLKESWRLSNRGRQWEEQILKKEIRKHGFENWENGLLSDNPNASADSDGEDTVEIEEGLQMIRDLGSLTSGLGAPTRRTRGAQASLGGQRLWGGIRNVRVVEDQLALPGLEAATRSAIVGILRDRGIQPEAVDIAEINIERYTRLRIQYPAVHSLDITIAECQYATDKYRYWGDKDCEKPRFDTVLIRYTSYVGDNEMSNRRIARLRLLFAVTWGENQRSEFAFVQLFENIGIDEISGMFRVKKTPRHMVVELAVIERGAHLIPDFGSERGTSMATGDSPPALDTYERFWINNQVDLHMYNTIYTPESVSIGTTL